MEGSDKSDLRSTWRRRQALNRRHGGRRGGRGSGRGNLAGRGRTSNANTTVPEQRDRYGDDDGEDDEGSSGDDRGAREDYAAWLSMVPKDSQDLLRRSRVSLPDVHEYTQFVLEARKVGGLGDADGLDDASLDLEAIGACLRGLPRDALLGTSRAAVEELVRAVVADDPYLGGEEPVKEPVKEQEQEAEEMEEKEEAVASLGDALDKFLDLGGSGNPPPADATRSTLEDDLAWFDEL